jgi:fucose 4-O-acetylase-like acetyltransferase
MEYKKEKDLSVETLRGAAIILVVIGHVIGSGSDGGMQVKDDSFLRHFYYTFEYLRMPLFTVISGWVYALHPASLKFLDDFIIKKVRRILLPMIFVGASYFLLQFLVPGTNKKGDLTEIWKILVFPYTLFWYLPSLFLVFLVTSIIDSCWFVIS